MMTTEMTMESAESVAGGLVAQATSLAHAIQDEATFTAAAEFMKKIKKARKDWEAIIGPVTKKAHEAWKEAIGLEKKVDAPLERAEKMILSPAMSNFRQAQERARRIEEDRLQREAQKRADDEALAHATELAQAGFKEEADAAIADPIPAAAPVVPAAPRVEGLSERLTWNAEIVDKLALVKAVAEGRAPLGAIEANMPFLNGVARSLKSEFNVPGCRAVSRHSFAGR
jgi:hypothetical protein